MEWNTPHANTLCILIFQLLMIAGVALYMTYNGGFKWDELLHPTTQSHCSLR